MEKGKVGEDKRLLRKESGGLRRWKRERKFGNNVDKRKGNGIRARVVGMREPLHREGASVCVCWRAGEVRERVAE